MPGTASLNLTSAQALRDYVEDFSDSLIVQGFYGHKTADYSTPHENVKGKKWLTSLLISDLARRWAKQFNAPADTLNFKPRALITEDAKVELEIYPKDFESSYLGKKRKKGQGMDIPFEGEIMSQVMKKLAQEMDFAHINGSAAATPASTDLLKQLFNGLAVLITELIADGHAPETVPGGTITESNILPHTAALIDGIGDGYREGDLQLFMSKVNARKYYNAWVTKYNGNKPQVTYVNGVQTLEMEQEEGKIVVLPSWKGNRMVCTPTGNLHHGYDDISDWTMFNFKEDIRCIKFWMDFKFGVQLFLPDENAFMVNNLV